MEKADKSGLVTPKKNIVTANRKQLIKDLEEEKQTGELAVTKKELAFEKQEKKMRAEELEIANIELVFQNQEKEKRSAELLIANRELLHQNEEKEKRAAELVVANRALEKAKSDIAELNIGLEQKILTRTSELEAVNKELESFSYSVSHDLRSPLRAINGFSQVLVEDFSEQLNEEANLLLNEIIWNSKKMGELIDNLLEFSHISRKQVLLTDVKIKDMVDSVIRELKRVEPERHLKIIIKNLKNINGDVNMLRQVFLNLISNAFKYTGKTEKAVIEIGCSEHNNLRTYYVKDNGAGFDMKYYDNLFGVFQRLHNNDDFEGTGIGLSIVERIITKHRGKVWAEGQVDKGACFYFSLPIEEPGNVL